MNLRPDSLLQRRKEEGRDDCSRDRSIEDIPKRAVICIKDNKIRSVNCEREFFNDVFTRIFHSSATFEIWRWVQEANVAA